MLYVIVDKSGNILQESVATSKSLAWLNGCLLTRNIRNGWYVRCNRIMEEISTDLAEGVGELLDYRLVEAEVIEKKPRVETNYEEPAASSAVLGKYAGVRPRPPLAPDIPDAAELADDNVPF